MLWKIKTKAEDNIAPNKTILACLELRKIIEEQNIKRKAEKINQKDPISNAVPKKETWEAFEKKAERKNIKTTPPPPNKHTDLGKLILPSKNRAIAQKIMQRVSPITKSNPLEISIGIFVKGKKKTGNNTTTKKSDRNESRSNIFVYISSLYYSLI